MSYVRAAIFYLGYSIATIVWGGLSVLVAWVLPFRTRFAFIIGCWTRFSLWWLKLTCGIECRVHGRERIPPEPCIVMCRHESTWETLFLQTLFAPQATLIKRELLWIPFFGWAFALLKPIAIDRGNPRRALRKLIHDGVERLEDRIWVVLFPEGTRMPPNELGRFQVGGAALAGAAGKPILVIAHDAGRYWPAHRYLKRPGVINLIISEPIDPAGKDSKTLTEESRTTMQSLLEMLRSGSDVQIDHG